MEWLREIRLEEKRTQQNVADEVGVSSAFYSMIETGERKPSVRVAKRIAEVLGFPSEWYRLLEPSESA